MLERKDLQLNAQYRDLELLKIKNEFLVQRLKDLNQPQYIQKATIDEGEGNKMFSDLFL